MCTVVTTDCLLNRFNGSFYFLSYLFDNILTLALSPRLPRPQWSDLITFSPHSRDNNVNVMGWMFNPQTFTYHGGKTHMGRGTFMGKLAASQQPAWRGEQGSQ